MSYRDSRHNPCKLLMQVTEEDATSPEQREKLSEFHAAMQELEELDRSLQNLENLVQSETYQQMDAGSKSMIDRRVAELREQSKALRLKTGELSRAEELVPLVEKQYMAVLEADYQEYRREADAKRAAILAGVQKVKKEPASPPAPADKPEPAPSTEKEKPIVEGTGRCIIGVFLIILQIILLLGNRGNQTDLFTSPNAIIYDLIVLIFANPGILGIILLLWGISKKKKA